MPQRPATTTILDRAAWMPCLFSVNVIVSTVAAVAVCALLWRVHEPHATAAVLLGARRAGVAWPGGCDYGAQPYYFEDSGKAPFNETPGEWRVRTYDSACQPRQLIEPLLNASRSGEARADPLVIVSFGDSIDRMMIERFCHWTGAPLRVDPGPKPTQEFRYREITYCNSSALVLIHSWTNGMMHQAQHQVMLPERAIAMAAGVLVNVTGRESPDILFFGSNLWDLRAFMQQDPDLLPGKKRLDVPPKPYLGVHAANQYIDNVRRFLGMLRDKFPDTRFTAVHTTSQYNPRTLLSYEAVNRGQKSSSSALELPEGHSRQIMMNNWVGTLNAALRHLARQDGVPLVDLETLHLQLPAAHCYTPDGTHPHGGMLVSVCMNLVLNMYERDTGSDLLAVA